MIIIKEQFFREIIDLEGGRILSVVWCKAATFPLLSDAAESLPEQPDRDRSCQTKAYQVGAATLWVGY